MIEMTDSQTQLIELLAQAKKIFVFTGAGISTGSGIPDYRGPQGVWRTRKPVYYQDFMSSEQARARYWQMKLEDRKDFVAAKPNPAHFAVADLERVGKLELLVTQNIDGLHSAAGVSREKLVELHGSNGQVECQQCNRFTDPQAHFDFFEQTGRAPLCDECDGLLKPATISFGQNLREHDLRRAHAAAEAADLAISLGSTLAVEPAASFPLIVAERGLPYVIINRGETGHDNRIVVTLRIEGDVTEIFPRAVQKVL
jgi:NAD-dependent protein deacetylase/lipoamidase